MADLSQFEIANFSQFEIADVQNPELLSSTAKLSLLDIQAD